MKDARFRACVGAAARAVLRWPRWKPETYDQAWLFVLIGPMPMGWVIGFLAFETYTGWWHPFWELSLIGYPITVVAQGLAWSYDVYQRGEP
jgi:hypothetical protein